MTHNEYCNYSFRRNDVAECELAVGLYGVGGGGDAGAGCERCIDEHTV